MPKNFVKGMPTRSPIVLPMPRRSFLALSVGLLALTTAGVVAGGADEVRRLAASVDELERGVEHAEGAPDEDVSENATYVIGEDLDAGLITVRTDGAADEGWVTLTPAGGERIVWPATGVTAEVTLSLREGDTLTLADGVTTVEPHLADDLADVPDHAGLLVVGHDIEAGDWELTPEDEDILCDYEDTESHPTLAERTLGYACDQVRMRIGSYVFPWCGYVLTTLPDASGDITRTTDAASPLYLGLTTGKAPEVRLTGSLGRDARDTYLSALETIGHTHVDTDSGPVIVTLTDGQLICPVMMRMRRFHAIDTDERARKLNESGATTADADQPSS